MNACQDFRRRLMQAVLDHEALAPLSWDAHVLGCGECRALIEDEERLDHLLAAWMAPRLDAATRERVVAFVARERELDALLDVHARHDAAARPPRDLARRVVAALRRRLEAEEAAADPLDALLDEPVVRAPAGLARRTGEALRARLAADAEARLDRLLDLDRVEAPAGLAARTVRAVKQTGQPAAPARGRLVLVRGLAWFATAAAAALVAWVWLGRDEQAVPERVAQPESRPADGQAAAQGATDLVASAGFDERLVDERLLGQLETLEEIEALLGGDVDLMLSTMDASEEALLDLAPGEETNATEEPKKG